MNYYNVSGLISDLSRKVSPGNPSESRDIFGTIAEGARQLVEEVSPKELSRRQVIENALFDQQNQYTPPEDMNEKKIMQWYRLKGNKEVDSHFHMMKQVTNREFDRNRDHANRRMFTIEWQSGVRFVKVADFGQDQGGITIHEMNSITDNGYWNVFGNATNIATDNLTYLAGNGSVRFDLNTSSNTGGIINFTMDTVDISEYMGIGKIFTWLDIPNLNQIQTVTLDLLTNSSNLSTDYYSITVNSPHNSTEFQVGQNMLGFMLDQSTMNTIGTPNPRNVIGLRFTIVTNGTLLMRNIRMDNVVLRKGSVYGVQYLSQYVFEDAETGLWKIRPTKTSDIIHLMPGTYQLLLDYCALELGEEIFSGAGGQRDRDRLKQQLDETLRTYKKRNKTEYIDEQQEPYRFGAPFGGPYGNTRTNWDHQGEMYVQDPND